MSPEELLQRLNAIQEGKEEQFQYLLDLQDYYAKGDNTPYYIVCKALTILHERMVNNKR